MEKIDFKSEIKRIEWWIIIEVRIITDEGVRLSVGKFFFVKSASDLFNKTLPSAKQHPSYGDCLEVKREYYQNCSVLDCMTQCSQSAAHLYEQFLQVQQIGFVTLGPLRCA